MGSRHLSSVRVGLEVSLAHGMVSFRMHTGHPKHMMGPRQAGLLPSRGGTKANIPLSRKVVRTHLAAGSPRVHRAREGATRLRSKGHYQL